MTNQQGAPEALYASAMEFAAEKASISYVQRKCRCSWNDAEQMLERMVREGIIATYNGRKSAALVEAQQPATHVQDQAKIEHVAGDVSKNGAESDMAQQPAPSAAALRVALEQAARQALETLERASDAGYSVECDETITALREALEQVAPRKTEQWNPMDSSNAETALQMAVVIAHRDTEAAHQQATPHADSQPAPVLDRARIREIFMAHGFTVKEGQTDLKQYVYDAADALLRAARAAADSVTAPAGGATGKNLLQVQAADSVLEDAARLDWLEQNIFHREMDEWDSKFGGRGNQSMWVLFAPKGVQGSARKIIDAARKQGANLDNSPP